MSLLDCFLVQIEADRPTRAVRTTANAVATIVSGKGATRVGNRTLYWRKNDVFTVPQGQWTAHSSDTPTARIFITSDREIYLRLGMLREEVGSPSV